MQHGNRKAGFILKLLFGLVLLSLLFYQVDLAEFVAAIGAVSPEFIVASLCVSAFSMYVKAYKWKLLLEFQGAVVGYLQLVSYMFMSMFFNNFFLGTLGGDGLRAIKTFNYTRSKADAVSVLIVDRITGVIALAIIAVASAGAGMLTGGALSDAVFMDEIFYIGLAAVPLSIMAVFYLPYLMGYIKTDNGSRLIRFLRDTGDAVASNRLHHKHMVSSLLLAIFYHLVNVVSMYFFVLAVGIDLRLVDLMVIVPVVSFVQMIPVSVNGLGLQEGIFFSMFIVSGVEKEEALLLSVLPRIGVIVLGVIGAYLFIRDRKPSGIRSI